MGREAEVTAVTWGCSLASQADSTSIRSATACPDRVSFSRRLFSNLRRVPERAAIARALAIEPKAILLDEPTSALDPELVGEVLRVIRDLASGGTTMMLVTHELKFARETASWVVFLQNGEIAEQGPPRQVLEKPQTQACERFIHSEFGLS